MSRNKPTAGGRAPKKSPVSLVRSSAAEYLTFVAASGQSGVEAVAGVSPRGFTNAGILLK